jgi:hypothetical protein
MTRKYGLAGLIVKLCSPVDLKKTLEKIMAKTDN